MKELWKWLVERCRENRLYRKILKTHCDRISFDHKDAGTFYLTREVVFRTLHTGTCKRYNCKPLLLDYNMNMKEA